MREWALDGPEKMRIIDHVMHSVDSEYVIIC